MSTPTPPLTLAGAHRSPYSIKMWAVLRYRQIPFRWVPRNSWWEDLPPAPVLVIPVIAYWNSDGSYGDITVDSSPQIARLEPEYEGRSLFLLILLLGSSTT